VVVINNGFATIASRPRQALQVLTGEESTLALTHSVGMTYDGLKAFIGTDEAPGH
jgi:hypothetical protein